MQGYKTLWIPGIDHASIAVHVLIEKELAKEGLTRHKIGRETFNKYADQYGVMMFVDLPDHLDREEASKLSEEFRTGKKFFEPRYRTSYRTLWDSFINLLKRWLG